MRTVLTFVALTLGTSLLGACSMPAIAMVPVEDPAHDQQVMRPTQPQEAAAPKTLPAHARR